MTGSAPGLSPRTTQLGWPSSLSTWSFHWPPVGAEPALLDDVGPSRGLVRVQPHRGAELEVAVSGVERRARTRPPPWPADSRWRPSHIGRERHRAAAAVAGDPLDLAPVGGHDRALRTNHQRHRGTPATRWGRPRRPRRTATGRRRTGPVPTGGRPVRPVVPVDPGTRPPPRAGERPTASRTPAWTAAPRPRPHAPRTRPPLSVPYPYLGMASPPAHRRRSHAIASPPPPPDVAAVRASTCWGDAVKVLYIAGVGRSGSTLLERMLGAVPGSVNAGELNAIFSRVASQDQRCGCGEPFSPAPFGGRGRRGVRRLGRGDRADGAACSPAWSGSGTCSGCSPASRRATYRRELDEYLDVHHRLYRAIAARVRGRGRGRRQQVDRTALRAAPDPGPGPARRQPGPRLARRRQLLEQVRASSSRSRRTAR